MPGAPSIYSSQQSQYSPVKSSFDRKGYTRPSWQPPSPAPRTKFGSLGRNFNRHPDAFLMAPYGDTNIPELAPNTASNIKGFRWIQFGLRDLEIIGALGLLFCVVVIKNAEPTTSWIMRIPPGIDVLTTGYAMYHLLRSVNSRSPASSASYHFFALVIDLGLVGFYVFTALMAQPMSGLFNGTNTTWTTYWSTADSQTISLATFLISTIIGGLHLISAAVSVYLGCKFRKIAKLPPHMNPFESDSCPLSVKEHKYKNSNLSSSTISGVDSAIAIPTLPQVLPGKEVDMTSSRPVQFMQTRTRSDHSYSPHNPTTAAAASRSRINVTDVPATHAHPSPGRGSRVDARQRPARSEAHSSAPTQYSHGFMSEPSTQERSVSPSSSVYSARTSTMKSENSPDVPRRSSRRDTSMLLTDNMFLPMDNGNGDLGSPRSMKENLGPEVSIVESDDRNSYDPYRTSQYPSSNFRLGQRNSAPKYEAIPQTDSSPHQAQSAPIQNWPHPSRSSVQPLHMNPPTPRDSVIPQKTRPRRQTGPSTPEHARRAAPPAQPHTRINRPLATTSGNTAYPIYNTPPKSSTNNPRPKPSNGTPSPSKTRYYGDLNDAMSGVRGLDPGPTSRHQTRPTTAGATSPKKNPWSAAAVIDAATERKDWAMLDGGRKGRVVSRSGADAREEWSDIGLRGRNVSGKIAEEGRGDTRWLPLK